MKQDTHYRKSNLQKVLDKIASEGWTVADSRPILAGFPDWIALHPSGRYFVFKMVAASDQLEIDQWNWFASHKHWKRRYLVIDNGHTFTIARPGKPWVERVYPQNVATALCTMGLGQRLSGDQESIEALNEYGHPTALTGV